jgi:uncharacterized protein DUF4124
MVNRIGWERGTVMPAVALLFFLLASPAVEAAIYKCASEKGVVYQDTACTPGRELRNLDTDPATLSVVPGTPVPQVRSAAPAAKSAREHAVTVKSRGGNAAERKFVQAGMSEAEVIFRIGRPDVEAKGRGKEARQWSYMPVSGDPDTLTTLTFAGGKVLRVERKVVR